MSLKKPGFPRRLPRAFPFPSSVEQGLLSLGASDILGHMVLVKLLNESFVDAFLCSVHHRKFSSTPGLDLLDASSSPFHEL